jgi:Domain of unknown function (DUF4286)
MPAILYTVRATCKDIQQRGRFLSWLSPNHVLQVKAGGATAVRIVLPLPDDRSGQTPAGQQAGTARSAHNDSVPAVVETQYAFPSRKAFDTYIREHAPALRADAMSHFPPESGVIFERQVSEIATEL